MQPSFKAANSSNYPFADTVDATPLKSIVRIEEKFHHGTRSFSFKLL